MSNNIEFILKHLKIDYEKEFRFSKKRKFRFDFAVPKFKIAIEYEGLASAKSRHTTISGYSKDCEKYNLATMEGWRILRYTALNDGDCLRDLIHILKIKVESV